MNGNRFGTLFQVTTWGESHGVALGAIIDGCPSRIPLSEEDFQQDMARRQGGNSSFSTPRKEEDLVRIESGVFEGLTTGTPISLRIENKSQKSGDYDAFRQVPRPGHADLTTYLKHGHYDHRGGGRSSARETAARVAAGVVAKKVLATLGIDLAAWISRAGPHEASSEERRADSSLDLSEIRARRDRNPLASPYFSAPSWAESAEELRSNGESWGGSVICRIDHLPPGLGEPVFDKLQAVLAHSMMSLPAAVGFEAGGGFALSRALGSEVRDAIGPGDSAPPNLKPSTPRPLTNRHGGLLGGMSTGLPLFVSVAFHAPTSIPAPIMSVDLRNNGPAELRVGGRHDAFPLPRILPAVEAMVAMVIVDFLMRAGRIGEKLAAK